MERPTRPTPITVLVVDDHEAMRRALRVAIEAEPGMMVVGESGDGVDCVAAARRLRPDVVVMDVVLPGRNGIDATRAIVGAVPGCRVLALSVHGDRRLVSEAVAAGARGYLLKESAGRDLLDAVRAVVAGELYLDPALDAD